MFRKLLLLISLAISVVACGSDTEDANNSRPECEFGERYNSVIGECVPVMTNNVNNTNNDQCEFGERRDQETGECVPVSTNNTNNNNNMPDGGMNNTMPDMGEDMPIDMVDTRCAVGIDEDNDGLDNACECTLGTRPDMADTDGDGLTDAQEDADGSCTFTPGETDPREADTDGDGTNDGDEVMAGTDPLLPDTDMDGIGDTEELASCLDPNSADTDMDGIPDGVEDANQDGQLGTCVDHMWDAMCAGIESNPCDVDTDGDRTDDGDEAQYIQCTPEDLMGLTQPLLVSNMTADYQLALEPGITNGPVTGDGNPQDAHVFEGPTAGYTGFVVSLTPPGGETNPSPPASSCP